jgi:hypothetical protein
VHDQTGRVLDNERCQWEVPGTRLPERGDALVEDAVGEQTPDDAVLALHGVEICMSVATSDRHARDEVVEDEVVEDDDTGPPSKGVHDPRVRVGVVADVVERQVRAARSALAPAPDDRQVESLA